MKTFALQKIIERKNILLGRIAYKVEKVRKNEMSADDLAIYYRDYKSEFKGYIRAFWDMELLTDKERQNLYDSFIEEIYNIQ